MEPDYFSLRMHASVDGAHLSGAERLLLPADLEGAVQDLVRRALAHPAGQADAIRLSIDRVESARLSRGMLPDLRTLLVADVVEGRAAAQQLLRRTGVTDVAITSAMTAMAQGAAGAGRNMRGAMLVDAVSGERREPDIERGVRASRMDLSPRTAERLDQELAALGLGHRNVREALVLAGKVCQAPGVVAELCWSDDPDYSAGYVCSDRLGYLRLPHLKTLGDPHGGRAFFITPGTAVEPLMDWLQNCPVLFEQIGRCHPAVSWREYAGLLAAGT